MDSQETAFDGGPRHNGKPTRGVDTAMPRGLHCGEKGQVAAACDRFFIRRGLSPGRPWPTRAEFRYGRKGAA